MFVISNNCFSGFLYKKLEKIYNHPFIWNLIHLDDFTNLVKHFNEIDFKNFDLESQEHLTNFKIVLEDYHIQINKRHYKFSAKDTKPRKDKNDLYYCKIWEVIVDEYEKRLDRMYTLNEKPIFILHYDEYSDDFKDKNFKNKVLSLMNYCNEHKIKMLWISSIDFTEIVENEYIKKIIFKFKKDYLNGQNFLIDDYIDLIKEKLGI